MVVAFFPSIACLSLHIGYMYIFNVFMFILFFLISSNSSYLNLFFKNVTLLFSVNVCLFYVRFSFGLWVEGVDLGVF